MSGRRSHVRFEMLQPPDGVLRIMREVVVQQAYGHEVIAISGEPGVLGESVTVDLEQGPTGMFARVADSQPVVISGSLRHRLRLEATGATS